MIKNHKSLFFILIISFLLVVVFPVFARDPLVPCGPGSISGADCQLCDFFVLAKNIIDFLIYDITPAAAVLFFVWGAVLLIISGTSEQASLRGQGKKIMTNTAFGILIVFSAWLIVNTFLNILIGNSADIGATARPTGFPWAWADYTCS
ncbi:MAG: hypothetical protein HYV52_02390 [Parcubacteria group bacterium]|nr:hypothetical protein [Parcubacteria group bacterium]